MLVLTMNQAEGTELLSLTHFNPQNEHKEIQVRESDVTEKTTREAGRRRRAQVGQTLADHSDAFYIDYMNNVH